MRDLKIGDKVLVGPNKYQIIYSFGHKLSEQDTADKIEYRKITMAGQNNSSASFSILEITPDHLIFRHGEDTPVPASLLDGTDLLVGKNREVLFIHKIETVYHHGLYSPFTADGTIVVGGALASTYPSFNKGSPNLVLAGFDTGISWHGLEHRFIKPVAFYCTVLSSKGCHDETYTDYGYNYATYAGVVIIDYLLEEVVNPVSQVIKVLLAVIALFLIVVAYAGTCFIESYATLPVLLLGFGYVAMNVLKSHAAKKLLTRFALKVKHE